MAILPEDKKLAEVEQQLEGEVAKLEEKVKRADKIASTSVGLHERGSA